MKKKQLKTICYALAAAAAVFALVTFFTAFAEAFSYAEKTWSFTGWQVMFGHSTGSGALSIHYLNFNILAVLGYVLPLAGGALVFSKSKGLNVAAVLCFAVSAILLFLMPEIAKLFVGEKFSAITEVISFSIGAGAICGGVFSVLGCLAVFAKAILR